MLNALNCEEASYHFPYCKQQALDPGVHATLKLRRASYGSMSPYVVEADDVLSLTYSQVPDAAYEPRTTVEIWGDFPFQYILDRNAEELEKFVGSLDLLQKRLPQKIRILLLDQAKK